MGNFEVATLSCGGDVKVHSIRNGKVHSALTECETHEAFSHFASWIDPQGDYKLSLFGTNKQNNRTISAEVRHHAPFPSFGSCFSFPAFL